MKFKQLALATALTASLLAQSALAADGKKELIQKMPPLQKSELDALASGITQAPVRQLLGQFVQPVMTQAVPPEKREEVAKQIDAEVQKYLQSATPIVQASANKIGPSAVAPLLEEKFTEEELRQLVTMLDSPVIKKYQALLPEIQKTLFEKVPADARAQVDPKLQTLQDNVRKILDNATGGKLSGGQSGAGKAAAKPAPAKK